MLWHEKSWPEIQALDKRLPVVVPLGSLEQHGHHLPLLVDTIQVTGIAGEVERRLPDKILLLPTLWLGSSDHHRDFPGTVTVSPSLYTAMIKDVVQSILSAGFSRLFLLNGHGGNLVPASQALSELVSESDQADKAYLALASWWDIASDALAAERHGMQSERLTHACEYETSLMMALRGDLVKQDLAKEAAAVLDNRWTHSEHGGAVRVFHRFRYFTAAGNMGQPRSATAKKGQSILAAVVDDVVALLEDFAAWPDLPPIGPT